jgi:hypothetical protein
MEKPRHPFRPEPLTKRHVKNAKEDGHDGRLGKAFRINASPQVLYDPQGREEDATRDDGAAKATERKHSLSPTSCY